MLEAIKETVYNIEEQTGNVRRVIEILRNNQRKYKGKKQL